MKNDFITNFHIDYYSELLTTLQDLVTYIEEVRNSGEDVDIRLWTSYLMLSSNVNSQLVEFLDDLRNREE